ncbi:MAG TPA: hypothetical protein VGG15_09485 [Terriglobales bacterium]
MYYDQPEASCIELKFPETPMQVPYFTRVLSMLNLDSEEHFHGGLLWLTLWTIGSPQLEKVGWKLVEKMRLAFVELNAFLLPCFIFGWDAFFSPSGQDYFVHISHDEYWLVVTKTKAAYETLFEQLQDLAPRKAHPNTLARFCRVNPPPAPA